jgi:hypothetical protein
MPPERTSRRLIKRRLAFVLVGCVLLLGFVWMFRGHGNETVEEANFRRMLRAERMGWRIYQVEQHLPLFLDTTLRLEGHRIHNLQLARNLEESLLASGFLTNVSVTTANLSVADKYSEVARRLGTMRNVEYLSYYIQTNALTIICRTSDLPRIRSRIEIP